MSVSQRGEGAAGPLSSATSADKRSSRVGATLDRFAGLRSPLVFVPLLLIYLAFMVVQPGFFDEGTADEGAFTFYAENLTHGHYADESSNDPVEYIWHGPGMALVLAPFVAADVPVEVLRVLGPLFLFFAVVLFHRLLLRHTSRRGALLGAYALGLYAPFYITLGHLYSEPLAILLVVAALYGTSRYFSDARLRWLLVAGGSLGGLAMTRLEYGPVITIVLVLALALTIAVRAWRPTLRRILPVLGVAVLVCVPWLAYTQELTGKFFYWSNGGALSLYWMASPDHKDYGEGHLFVPGRDDPRLAVHHDYFRRLQKEDPLEQDTILRRTATDRIKERPFLYARNVAAAVSRMFFNYPYRFYTTRLSILFYGGFSLAVLFGAVLAFWAAVRARRWRPRPELLPFVAIAVLGISLHALVAGQPRYTFPVVPILVFIAVCGITDNPEPWRRALARVPLLRGLAAA